MRAFFRKVLISFLFFSFIPAVSVFSEGRPLKILLIHSYHPEYPWVDSITRGVKNALDGKNVELEIFYMDTKRNTSKEWKLEAGRLAREKIENFKPDAVITADDNAQIFVAQQYLNKDIFFVFCGVNGDPKEYGFPANNITGILERPHLKESVRYLKEIIPSVRRIVVISDNDPTSIGALDYMQTQEPSDIKFLNYHILGDLGLWKERILEYNLEADAIAVYMYHTIKYKENQFSMHPNDVMRWTVENAKIPLLGFFDFSIEDGMFCGVVESGEEHGFRAAEMALALLTGTPIEQLPIETAEKALKMINLKTAKQLGITIPEKIILQADKVFK